VALFGRDDDDDDEDEEEIEYVLFQGATNGKQPDLAENRKLAAAGMMPAKELVSDALSRRCEMFKLQIEGPKAAASFFIDGSKRPGPRFPPPRANAVIQVLKLLAGLDITVRNKPQRGGLNAEYREIPFELTVKTTPVKGAGGKPAESLTVTFRNTKTKRVTPEDIGIPEVIQSRLRNLAANHEGGVVLVVGPPESGLTTTALCSVRCVDSYLYQCYLVGDLGTREILNVPVFKEEEGHPIEQTIERIHRNEGNLIFYSEFTDAERVKSIVKSSMDVSMMSEMYAKDAADGIVKFAELVGEPNLVAEQLRCVISHKLIRRLCPRCREAFRPSPRLLLQMGLPENTATLYRKAPPPEADERGEEPEPCRGCDDIGFRARTAIFEMIDVTEGMKAVIAGCGDVAAIRAQAKEDKQLTFQKDALRLVADGTTGLEELQRVFSGGKKKRPMKKRPMKKRPRP